MKQFTVFEYTFNNPELEEKFEKFFAVDGLTKLFSYEHKSTPIRVSLPDAQSIVKNGHVAEYFLDFIEILKLADDNKQYKHALLKNLDSSGTFAKLRNVIKREVQYQKVVLAKHQGNFWNIVWYSDHIYK